MDVMGGNRVFVSGDFRGGGPSSEIRMDLFRSGVVILSAVLTLAFFAPGRAAADGVQVIVNGVSGEVLQAVLAGLSIERQKDHPYLNEALVRRLDEQAAEEIARSLQPFGYYRPSVEVILEASEGSFRVVYTIDPGPPVTVSVLDLRLSGPGKDFPPLVEALDRFPLKKGDPLVHARYETGKKNLQVAALRAGFLDARYVEHQVLVDPDKGAAEVILILDTGPLFRFGPVTFRQDFLAEGYLRGFVIFREDDPYDQTVLIDLQKALYDTNQFSRVEVAALREDAVGLSIPVTVTLEPGPSRRFTAGVGYGTDTGPRLRTGWEHRRINRDVHRLRTDLLLSEVRSSLSARYVIPLKRPRTDHLDFSSALTRERVEDIDSDNLTVGMSLNRLRGRSQMSYFLRYLLEDYDVADTAGRTSLLIPGAAWTHVRADNRVNTRNGWRVGLEVQGTDEGVISDLSFLQVRFHAKAITGLGTRGRVILRGELGDTSTDDFSDLPASLRFFAGGDQSVRGYAFKSLGPVDSSGEVVGGRYLVTGSAEYEHRIADRWSLAVFGDTGNALEDLKDPLETGAGIGVRWQSVVGMIRLDVAWAVDRENNPVRIHLNIGPDL